MDKLIQMFNDLPPEVMLAIGCGVIAAIMMLFYRMLNGTGKTVVWVLVAVGIILMATGGIR